MQVYDFLKISFPAGTCKPVPPHLATGISQPTKGNILHDVQFLQEVDIENRNMNITLNNTLRKAGSAQDNPRLSPGRTLGST